MSAKGTKAGNIFLDLTLNKQGFNTQLNGITKLATKAGAAIAAAFSIGAVVKLAQDCIELGSDLAEVQNVVDVTFPTMSATIDKFSKDAAAAFGLSETMAKRYAGTLGSMAEAFGFSESQAAEMATTLAGLAGDVASFYNLSQDEAYTKLKSVFTGETESLKDLGVVMSQTALDQYALANGFGKTTKAMSEAEKVALRYAFVQDQLANATGDFSRTSDSWANQVKVLQLRIESIKASIGQGLINLFKPILIWINTIIAKLQVAADAFARFTSFFTKKDASSSGASSVAGELASAAASSDSVSSGLSSAASSAKKLKRELAGFDKITKLSEADTGSGSGGGAGGGTSDLLTGMTALATDSAKAIDEAYSPVIAKIKAGFESAFKADPTPMKEAFASLEESSAAVWKSQKVKDAIAEFRDQVLITSGQVVGSTGSIATSFGVGIFGGIAQARAELVEFSKVKLESIFNSLTDIADTIGDTNESLAFIMTALESPAFQKIVGIITKINDAISLTVLDKVVGFLKDMMNFFFQPIIQNKEQIKEVFQNIFEIFSLIVSPLEKLVDLATSRAKKYEDGPLHKFMEAATSDNVQYAANFLDVLNTGLETIIDLLTGDIKLSDVLEDLFPYVFGDEEPNDIVVEFKAEIKQRWSDLQFKWRNLTQNVKDKTVQFKAEIKQKWSELQSNWNNLTKNVKDEVAEFKAEIKQKWSDLQAKWTELTQNVKDETAQFKAEIKQKWSELQSNWNNLTKNVEDEVAEFKAEIKQKWEDLQAKWTELTQNVKDETAQFKAEIKQKWSELQSNWNNLTKNVEDEVAEFKAEIKQKWSDLRAKWTELTQNVKDKTAQMKAEIKQKWEDIKSSWTAITDNIKGKTADMKARVASKWEDLKGSWNTLLSNFKDKVVKVSLEFKASADEVKAWINTNVIDRINNALKNSNIPGIKNIRIPHLAQGGYVKANTPQLAVIGDNRHQGEVVAPENKLAELARKGAELAGNGGRDAEIIALLRQILELLKTINLTAYIDAEGLKRLIVKLINDHTRATGQCEIYV